MGSWEKVRFDGWKNLITDSIGSAPYNVQVDVDSFEEGDAEYAGWAPARADTNDKIELDGNASEVDAIYQQVDTVDGQDYTLSLQAYAREAGSGDVQIWWGDEYVETLSIGTDWDTHTVTLTGDGSRQTLMIREVPGQNNGQGTIINKISLVGVAPESDQLSGQEGDDNIYGSAGADVITGGEGSDTMTGNAGRDRFVWEANDDGTETAPAIDRITDFAVGSSGDILDLHQLLSGEENAELDQFISFRFDDGDTIIDVRASAGAEVTQQIILENTDLSSLGDSDAEIIEQLQEDGQLIISRTFSITSPVAGDDVIDADEQSAVNIIGVGKPGASVTVTIREPESDSVPDTQASWSLDGDLNGSSTMTFTGGSATFTDGPGVGQAVHLDGNNDELTATLNVSEESYAVGFWFRTTDSDGTIYQVSEDGSRGGQDRSILMDNGRIAVNLWQEGLGYNTITTTNTFNDGQWHYIVHTFGGSTGQQEVYIDGQSVLSGSYDQSGFDWQNIIRLGSNQGSNFFEGDIAELDIFDQALTPDEVRALYRPAEKATVNVDTNGDWSLVGEVLDVSNMDDGDLNITAIQTDRNNNSTSTTTTVSLESASTVPPIVLDLDGDGLEITSVNESDVMMDVDGDGDKERVAWVDSDDAFLITDLDGDGTLSSMEELFVARQTEADDTDMEALASLYDSNKDGVLNAEDERFSDLLIFQDKNQDGVADDGEVISLSKAGIEEISVVSDRQEEQLEDGSVIHGKSTYTRTDGSEGTVGDVELAYQEVTNDFSHSSAQGLETLIGDSDANTFHITHDDVTVTTGDGKDIIFFDINSEENPANLIITDFNTEAGDTLRIDDLLTDSTDSLDQLLSFSTEGDDTIMEIRQEAGGDVAKRVTFKDTDLTAGGASDVDVINSLLDNGNLQTDL